MRDCKILPQGPYPSARELAGREATESDSPQTSSPTYRLAFQDPDFLLRSELRPTRIQLEMIKPELTLEEQGVESTVVIYGSARIPDPETAQLRLSNLQAELEQNPGNTELEQRLKKASRDLENSRYYQEARRLGQIISNSTSPGRLLVITGGGPGIMEAANRGAHDVGGQSIGLNIVLEHEQVPNSFISPELCFQFHYFATRKMHFMIRSKGLVAFPGGFGTLDEIFETLTLLQTRKIKPIPVILFGRKFWERVINFQALVDEGTIDQQDLELFHYVESAEQAWEIIAGFNGLANPA
ncbi:MAG: TIGR00730 family Rossman fold protein [Desulfohalobiaceae bacterium]